MPIIPSLATHEQRDLFENNQWLARWFAKQAREKGCYRPLTYHQILSASYLGLMRAVSIYDPAKGKLSTIAHYWMRIYVQNDARDERFFRSHSRQFRYDPERTILDRNGDQNTVPPREREAWKALEEKLHGLPKDHRKMLRLRLQGYGLRSISDRMGCSHEWVRFVLRKIFGDLGMKLPEGSRMPKGNDDTVYLRRMKRDEQQRERRRRRRYERLVGDQVSP